MANQTTVDQELSRIELAKETLATKAVDMGLKHSGEELNQKIPVTVDELGVPQDALEDIAEAFYDIPMMNGVEDAVSITGVQVSVKPGFYRNYEYKQVTAGSVDTPTITINPDTGVITATTSHTEGYIPGGNKTETKQITHTNFTAGNIKTGVSMFGVTGTFTKVDGTGDIMPVESRFMTSGYRGFVNGNQVDGSATDFGVIENILPMYTVDSNGKLQKSTGWDLEEGFVRHVSLQFDDSAVVSRLQKI